MPLGKSNNLKISQWVQEAFPLSPLCSRLAPYKDLGAQQHLLEWKWECSELALCLQSHTHKYSKWHQQMTFSFTVLPQVSHGLTVLKPWHKSPLACCLGLNISEGGIILSSPMLLSGGVRKQKQPWFLHVGWGEGCLLNCPASCSPFLRIWRDFRDTPNFFPTFLIRGMRSSSTMATSESLSLHLVVDEQSSHLQQFLFHILEKALVSAPGTQITGCQLIPKKVTSGRARILL